VQVFDLIYTLLLPVTHNHRPVVSIQLCLLLLLLSSCSCTWSPSSPSTSLSPDLFSTCFLVAVFFFSLALSIVVLACQCCRHSFSVFVQASSIFFLLVTVAQTWHSMDTCAIHERLRCVFTTRHCTNPRLPLPYSSLVLFHSFFNRLLCLATVLL